MALALVKLVKQRGDQTYYILDWISEEVARLGVEINGVDHAPNEFAEAEIIKVFETKSG